MDAGEKPLYCLGCYFGVLKPFSKLPKEDRITCYRNWVRIQRYYFCVEQKQMLQISEKRNKNGRDVQQFS